ncbi:MFS transporter [Candidatus Poribacteria bacterium]|nr:MFS transporter [Candidatus Poribacteria bacterium]
MKESDERAAWYVVAAGFLSLTVAGGIGWFVFPVYLTSIQNDLGCSRTQLSAAVAVWAIVGGVFSPLVGIWIDKYGPRKVMMLATMGQVVAAFFLGRMTALWHLYLLFILSSLATTANTGIPVATAISQWFEGKRGTAMGIALVGMGFGGFVMPILANYFLEHYNWRTGYFVFSFFLLALLAPIQLWIRQRPAKSNSPAERGAHAGAEALREANTRTEKLIYRSMNVAEAARTRSFWGLSLGDFLISIVFTSVIVHMVAFTTDAGVSQSSATHAYSTLQAVICLGILVFGAASDRVKLRWMMVFCYGIPAIAMLFLFRLQSPWLLYTFAIIFGVSGGGRNALWPLALAESFGVANLGSLLGWLNIPYTIGNAIGPTLAGHIYDTSHSYRRLFIICIAVSACSAVFISRIRNERPPLGSSANTSA